MSRTETLVGREGELALASAAVRELFEGRASVLVIEGEAGIGKTRPFGVVVAALGLSRRSEDPRKAAIAALLAREDAAADPKAAEDIRYRVVEEVVDLIERACTQGPVVVVAEDLHWADSASLLAILSVVRQLPLEPVLVVVTTRPSPLPAEVVRFLDDVAVGGARTLPLHPLSPDEVAVLARESLGHGPGPALTAMLAKAGGNPLWVVATLRALADGGMLHRDGDDLEPTTFELPASLGDLVIRRLRQLPTATLELLEVTAVLGDAVSLRDVAAVACRAPAVWWPSSAMRSTPSCSTRPTTGSCSGTSSCTTRSTSTSHRRHGACCTARLPWH